MTHIQPQGWEHKPDGWDSLDKLYDTNSKKIIGYRPYNIDGIFVLAGGINIEGQCHPWVINRLDFAYDIHKSTNKPIYCLGGGSYHIPPILNKKGFPIHESTSCSEYLISLGVNPINIYKEWSSYDTIANAFYAILHFIIPQSLKSIVIITSDFHMPRTIEIFEWLKKCFQLNTYFKYLNAPDDNIDYTIINIRIKREKASLKNLKENVIPKYNTLEKVHKWFFTEHKAYCSNSELIRKSDIDKQTKESY